MVDNKAGMGPKELAKFLNKGEATIYRWIKSGEVKAVRLGPRLLLIPMGEVERLLGSLEIGAVRPTVLKSARAVMQPGDIRVDTRCPVCGGIAWVLPECHNDGQSCIAQCEAGCFVCWE